MAALGWKVIITDCDHSDIEEEKKVFEQIGAELVLLQLKTEEEVIRECREADGLINQYVMMTRNVFENLPKLKVISRYGVGFDPVDLKAATDMGIIVANVPDYSVEEVAAQAVALFLALTRKIAFFDRNIRAGHWDFREGIPIHRIRGKTMGLLGCGRIGREVSRLAVTLGMQVIAFDPYLQKAEGIRFVDFDTLLKDADVISVHCPLNESTRHLLDGNAFRKMRNKPLIVNTSRGPIIDEKALIEALKEGAVSGAGLDVLEKEPPDSQSPLLKMDNVILSPHVGFYSEQSIRELKRRAAENVASVLLGKTPGSVVNREVLGKTRAGLH